MSTLTTLSPGIALLQQAAQAAEQQCVDRWQFAIELKAFASFGVTVTDLRLLVTKGIAEHANETSTVSAKARRFAVVNSLFFPSRVCFVLSTSQCFNDVERNGKTSAANGHCYSSEQSPLWDGMNRTLAIGGQIIKRFKVPADAQETILTAFQEEGWPTTIDDPLPPIDGQVRKQRLHNTINALNRGQPVKVIQFRGNGKGTAVSWELRKSSSSHRVESYDASNLRFTMNNR
jgi:hypothetical protein